MKGFCYRGDRLSASKGCEAAVTARTRLRWKKFRKCGEILFGKDFFCEYVKSATLYGSKTWCLRENEVAIFRKIYGEDDVRCKVGGQEYRGADGSVGIEGSSR